MKIFLKPANSVCVIGV